MNAPTEEIAKQMEDLLRHEIDAACERHARIAELSDEQRDRLRELTLVVIRSLHLNIALNSVAAEIPMGVAFTAVIESLAEWNKGIDRISGRPEHYSN